MIRLTLAVAVFAATAYSQTAPAFFELALPDLNRSIPGGTNVVADIPIREINQMTIQVMGSADTNLTYGDLRVRVNGIGVRNIFDSGSNARGKFLRMTPETLKMRRDPIFDRQENTVEVYGKDRRGREYYQNWILRSSGADLNPYFSYISSMSPTDETGLPPDFALEMPAAPIVFPAGKPSMTVHIKGSASAASGVASLVINGKQNKPAAGPVAAVDVDTVITRGTKTLIVDAIDGKGNKRSISVPILYSGASGPPPKMAGTAWAVIVGVSRFTAKTGAPPALPLAAFDAKEMADALKSHGFKEENVKLLVDDQATVEQVRTALGDFAAKAKPEDLLLIYWSTQGLHDPASPDRVYLAASNTQALHLSDTAIETSELQLLLERSVRSRHTILFFDAEHPLGSDWGFQGKPIVNTLLLNLFDDQLGRSVLVSGSSAAASETGRSVFSTAVVEGITGKADIDQNHVVTAKEISDYVLERVKTATGGVQKPRAMVSKHEQDVAVMSLR